MKRIGIITLNGYFNYGNRLQNYALQEVLRSYGFEVETILNEPIKRIKEKPSFFKRAKNLIEGSPIKKINKKIKVKLYKEKLDLEREAIFREFSDKYIGETDFIISDNNIPDDLKDRYNFFVTGSDQIWNPYYRNGSSIDFLQFANEDQRVSYAASFGISTIPREYKDNYSLWLKNFKSISVREDAGAKIIKQLTGIDVPVVLDPTMLLTKSDWLSIAKPADNKPKKRYLLTYFLGEVSTRRKREIDRLAKEYNLIVINLAQFRYQSEYLTGPSEFIDYINSATIFCTDSFHGVAFSILLETPFIVYNREMKASPSMSSRFETVLKTFNFKTRIVNNKSLKKNLFNIDFTEAKSILNQERSKAHNFIKKSLEIE